MQSLYRNHDIHLPLRNPQEASTHVFTLRVLFRATASDQYGRKNTLLSYSWQPTTA